MKSDFRWDAVSRKDPSHDGQFLYGVLTTGIFCRPSCTSRRPLRENVRFYGSAQAAEADGLRACLRCRPTDLAEPAAVTVVRQMCDYIRLNSDGTAPVTLEPLAKRSGYSATQLKRLFGSVLGLTPRQFVESCRLDALECHLRGSDSIACAIYQAGFGSPSRVYERLDRQLGMTPKAYQIHGEGQTISHASFKSELGMVMVGATDRGVCFVQFGNSTAELLGTLRTEFPRATLLPINPKAQPLLDGWVQALSAHLRGDRPHADLPVDLQTSSLRFRVFRYLTTIPRGETRSYAQVAKAIGRPRAIDTPNADIDAAPDAAPPLSAIAQRDYIKPSNTGTARVQAPRSLWDTTYEETSWTVNDVLKEPLRLLPRVKDKIAAHYPGTGFALTEWN
jgi:AraC family transcriptional regulator, regulatory protein of adaptative response / methylated-DNA-[protein]-cysteine methyltransferase